MIYSDIYSDILRGVGVFDRKNGGIAWECNRTEIHSQEDRVAAELFKTLNARPIRPRAQCQVWGSGYVPTVHRLCNAVNPMLMVGLWHWVPT